MTNEQMIKTLENNNEVLIAQADKIRLLEMVLDEKTAEIERLNIRNKALTAITKNYDWKFAKAKSEAIKEFAEKLEEKTELLQTTDYFDPCIVRAVRISVIENLVKEMVGDTE